MRIVVAAAAACLIAGCSSTATVGTVTRSAKPLVGIPTEFRHACGHPRSAVRVQSVPVVVRHADCDLTGVLIFYRNCGGAIVLAAPGGVGNSQGLTIEVAAKTLDVTVASPTTCPGNA